MEKVLIKIAKKMKKDPSLQVYRDLYDFCREVMKTDIPLAVRYLVMLSEELDRAIPSGKFDKDIIELYSLHKRVLLSAAAHHFESFLLYIPSKYNFVINIYR